MKTALIYLSFCLSIALNSCALGMGQRRACDAPVMPARPEQEICIANGGGGAGCFDERKNPQQYTKPSIINYVCSSASETEAQEEWIKAVVGACTQ